METVFEVLNGRTITTFYQITAARIFLESVILERDRAMIVMVTEPEGCDFPCEEIIDVREKVAAE